MSQNPRDGFPSPTPPSLLTHVPRPPTPFHHLQENPSQALLNQV